VQRAPRSMPAAVLEASQLPSLKPRTSSNPNAWPQLQIIITLDLRRCATLIVSADRTSSPCSSARAPHPSLTTTRSVVGASNQAISQINHSASAQAHLFQYPQTPLWSSPHATLLQCALTSACNNQHADAAQPLAPPHTPVDSSSGS